MAGCVASVLEFFARSRFELCRHFLFALMSNLYRAALESPCMSVCIGGDDG